MRRHVITLSLSVSLSVSLVLAITRPASAQPVNAEAEALFQQGVALMDAGQLAEACAAFEGSELRSPATTTLLNAATCRERNGQLATAWGAYVEVERQTRGASDPTSQTLHAVAEEHAIKLKARLSVLTVNVAANRRIPGLEIVRDTVAIDAAAWNRSLPADGGTYVITARAPGHDSWTSRITIGKESDAKTVDVPVLAVTKAVVIAPRPKTVPLILAGSAVVLLGGGLSFELSAEGSYNKYKLVGGNSPLIDSADHKRYAAEGLALGGVAAAAVGAWFYFRHVDPESPPRRGVAVLPTIGADGAGVQIFGRY